MRYIIEVLLSCIEPTWLYSVLTYLVWTNASILVLVVEYIVPNTVDTDTSLRTQLVSLLEFLIYIHLSSLLLFPSNKFSIVPVYSAALQNFLFFLTL